MSKPLKRDLLVTIDMTDSTALTVVIVARHGERLDYVMRDRGENWIASADRPWDPPLSDHGMEQARKLGKQIELEIRNLQLPPLGSICSSPFLRCRQTAASALSAMDGRGDRKIRVEHGLAESINESWYRSWSIPGTDGSWGYIPRSGDRTINGDHVHPFAKKPIQTLLDWQSVTPNDDLHDYDYQSLTQISSPYCFYPRLLESRSDQQRRMLGVVEAVAIPGSTVVLVSHGGPVTHLYESMTERHWNTHGESSYCCYTIYRKANSGWETLRVNEASYLHEKVVHENHVTE